MEKTTQKAKPPLCAADFRAIAREALKGKWKKGSSFFLLSYALINAFGLSIVQEHFFTGSASPVPGLDMFETMIFGHNPQGFGWALAIALLIWNLVNSFLYVGQRRLCIRTLDGEEPHLKQLFPAKLFGKAAVMGGLRTILLRAPGLLIVVIDILLTVRLTGPLAALGVAVSLPVLLGFIIWVIVVSFGLQMSDYLMAKDEPIGPVAALKASWRKMRGWKWRYFCLGISFIGWLLLAMLPGNLFRRWVPIGNTFLKDLLVWFINLAVSSGIMLYMTAATAAFFRHVETMEIQEQAK